MFVMLRTARDWIPFAPMAGHTLCMRHAWQLGTPDTWWNSIRHAWQASMPDGCMAVIRHAWTGISHQICLIGGYYVICPLKFSLFTTIVFFNVFLRGKNCALQCLCASGCQACMTGRHMPVKLGVVSGMPHSIWPAYGFSLPKNSSTLHSGIF